MTEACTAFLPEHHRPVKILAYSFAEDEDFSVTHEELREVGIQLFVTASAFPSIPDKDAKKALAIEETKQHLREHGFSTFEVVEKTMARFEWQCELVRA